MLDEVSFLMKMVEEQRNQGRQSENQRATITNLIVTISAGLIALITNKSFSHDMIALSILLTILGIYGMISSAKLYERWNLHRKRARIYEDEIVRLLPNLHYRELNKQADELHRKKHPFVSKIRLNVLWLFFHFCIVVAGIVCTYVILVKP
jgi:uncharacterized membrane protein YbhN (UPF0104 family)